MTSVTNSGVHSSASISPDGRLIAYIQNYKNQKGAVYLRQAGTNIETELFSRETGTFGMTAFSPDGIYLYFYLNDYASSESGIYRVPVIGGNATLMTSKAQNGHFSLSPDGKRASMVRGTTSKTARVNWYLWNSTALRRRHRYCPIPTTKYSFS
jgi:Tol biopolymer transport system component